MSVGLAGGKATSLTVITGDEGNRLLKVGTGDGDDVRVRYTLAHEAAVWMR